MARSRVATVVAVVLGFTLVGCLVGWIFFAWLDDRFANHSVVADAVILDSDVGCLGAIGGPWRTSDGGFGETITYQVRFPYRGGLHTTSVTKGCGVIPPDFGRGRGAIWVEYDQDDPDRIRVLTDDAAGQRARWFREGAVTVVAAAAMIVIIGRQRHR